MKKERTIYVRHDYNTNEPLAVAVNYEELQKKKSEWLYKKGEEGCVYDREYVRVPEEGATLCGETHYPKPLRFCPHCGDKLFTRDEEVFESKP